MPGDDIPVGSELADERVDLREGNRLVMVEPGAHAAVRRRAGGDGDGAGNLDVVNAVVLRRLQNGAHAADGEFFDVGGSDGRAERTDVWTKLPRALQQFLEWRRPHPLSRLRFYSFPPTERRIRKPQN